MDAPVPLLAPGEPPAVTVLNRQGRAPVLLVCDHASNRVPASLAQLGLPEAELSRHIGWDIGAAAVTERLAALLDAPAVLTGYSRLVVDCNRRPDDPTLMPEISDGTTVPGNLGLAEAERERRMRALFRPYHDRVAGLLAESLGRGVVPAVVSVHSFTPVMRGFARPWHVGVLWNRDPRLAVPLLEALAAEGDLVVGDNEPYSARTGCGHTINTHCEPAGIPSVMLEIRQDLIGDTGGAHAWADRLHRLFRPILAREGLHTLKAY